jgi:hypothetical protein
MALKHHVTFKNIFGDKIEKDLYFNITKAELTELNYQYEDDGGFDGRIKRLGDSGTNGKLILETLKNILGTAYGERQGDALVKGPDVKNRFFASEEYSSVFEDLANQKLDPYKFISAMLPEGNGVADPEKTPSERAREASEARMQGHLEMEPPLRPHEVVELATAEPVLEKAPEPTQEQLMEAWKKSQNLS